MNLQLTEDQIQSLLKERIAAYGRQGGSAKVKKGAAMLSPEERAERSRRMVEARRAKALARKNGA